jgi:peptidoglycan/xylan/chitin deacetylase (PgdA/CDA1 family)
MTTAAIVAGLWPACKRVLLLVGRWLIRRISTQGVERVVHFMELRIETFEGRRERARSDRRKAWLTARIGRWRKALGWVRKQVRAHLERAAKALDELAEKEALGWDAPDESYDRWARNAA